MKQLAPYTLLGVLGAILWFYDAPTWWLGAALMAGALGAMAQLGAKHTTGVWERMSSPLRVGDGRRAWVYELVAVSVILAIVTPALLHVSFGEWPVDHDHPVHFFKALQLKERFLEEGRILGWSHQLFAGYPVNYLYPFGGDLFVVAVYYACFGLISFSSAYGLAIWLLAVLSAYSVYALGKRYVSWIAGLLGAIFHVADTGAFRYGGWTYTMDWGVWPQALGTALAMIAISRLPDVFDGRRWRPVGVFGTLGGLAVISHPASIILLGVTLPVAFACRALNGEKWRSWLLRFSIGCFILLCVASLLVVPLITLREFSHGYGHAWRDAAAMSKALYEGTLLKGSSWFVTALAVVGVVRLGRKSDWKSWLIAFSVVTFYAVGTSEFLEALGFTTESGPFSKVQFERLSTMLKPFWFVAAGVTGALALRLAADEPSKDRHWRVAVRFSIAALLLAPTLGEFATTLWTNNFKRTPLIPASERPRLKDRQAVIAWAKKQPNVDGFYRWFFVYRRSHFWLDMGFDLGAPTVKHGFTPCSTYIYKVDTMSPSALQALNVRWLLNHERLKQKREDLVHIQQFGDLHIYEHKNFSPDPFKVIRGKGDVELVSFADEEIVLRVADGAKGTLRLNVSYFPRWTATRNGVPVPIGVTPLRRVKGTGFMTVPLAPGQYRFVFERSRLDTACLVSSLLGLLFALGLGVVDVQRPAVSSARRFLAWCCGWGPEGAVAMEADAPPSSEQVPPATEDEEDDSGAS